MWLLHNIVPCIILYILFQTGHHHFFRPDILRIAFFPWLLANQRWFQTKRCLDWSVHVWRCPSYSEISWKHDCERTQSMKTSKTRLDAPSNKCVKWAQSSSILAPWQSLRFGSVVGHVNWTQKTRRYHFNGGLFTFFLSDVMFYFRHYAC